MTEENSKYEIEFYEGSKEECLVEISFREAHKMLLAWGFTAPFCE